MQMIGAYGYAVESDMERQVSVALVTTIYGGTSEIQREIIARTLGALTARSAPARPEPWIRRRPGGPAPPAG
jgi:Acyl-CoA dehydrogenase, C-terminal domain